MTIINITNSNSKLYIEASVLENGSNATIYTEGSVNLHCDQITNIAGTYTAPNPIAASYLYCKGNNSKVNITANNVNGGAICEDQAIAVVTFKQTSSSEAAYQVKQGAYLSIVGSYIGALYVENAKLKIDAKQLRSSQIVGSECLVNIEDILESLRIKSSICKGRITTVSDVEIQGASRVNITTEFIDQLTIGYLDDTLNPTPLDPSVAEIKINIGRVERLFLAEDMKGNAYLTGNSIGLLVHNSLMHAYVNVANIGRANESNAIILHSHSSHNGISYPGGAGDGATHGGYTYFGPGGGQEGGLPASKEGTLRIYNALISDLNITYAPDAVHNDMNPLPIYFGTGSTNKRLYLSNCTIRTTAICCIAKADNSSTPAVYILGTLWVTKPLTVDETQQAYVNSYYGTTVLDPTF